jgi:hypothetical protein
MDDFYYNSFITKKYLHIFKIIMKKFNRIVVGNILLIKILFAKDNLLKIPQVL